MTTAPSEVRRREDVRNIAIIAHVDHGKTTLVDAMLKATGSMNLKMGDAQEQVLDSNELERERGITILSKNTSVPYRGKTINIVDTPGHADFGSEVERVLAMVDGVLLLVDAADGPMPQTRFVLRKALGLGLRPIVVLSKMDRPQARPHEALSRVFDLFIDLGATDEQLDFPVVYTCAQAGWASLAADKVGKDLEILFETILKSVPGPAVDPDAPLQMQVTILDYSSYVGRIGIGRIRNGRVLKGQRAALAKADGRVITGKVTLLERYFGLKRREVDVVEAGDIVALAGFEDISIGDTVTDAERPSLLPPMSIDEPTLAMEFSVNDSPLSGREGKFVTSRHLRDRLLKEQQTNVGLKIEPLAGEGRFRVKGRGELHLSVLIETMRREGYELSVSRPEVLYKEQNGKTLEPIEYLVIDVPAEHQGTVIESLGRRAGQMAHMETEGTSRVRLEYTIPSRGLLGLKSELLTMTKGLALMHHSFHGWSPKGSDPAPRAQGVLIAKEPGKTTAYALYNLQERGILFLGAGVSVYEGMIIGATSRGNDLVVNPCKAKALTNMRSKSTDEALTLEPARPPTLEQALEFIDSSELLEVTPQNLRLRKKVLVTSLRRRAEKSEAYEDAD